MPLKKKIIQLDTPSLYRAINKENNPIIIYDHRGVFFHLVQNQKQDYFTIPAGQFLFITNGDFEYLGEHKYILQLPPVQRYIPFKFKKFVPVKNYPNLASIYYHEGVIVIDEDLIKAPLPILEAIVQHEQGHIYYDDERLCDIYSSEIMKQKGYNASQINAAFQTTLYSQFRKNEIKAYLQNYKL